MSNSQSWIEPRRLVPDLALALWVLAVGVYYLGSHLADAMAYAAQVTGS